MKNFVYLHAETKERRYTMGKNIRTITVFYDTEISDTEIPLFRGAVLKSLGDKADVLYHNHTGEDSFRYSYPLIQYKRLNGKAAIVCVDEGVGFVGQLLTELCSTLTIGNREVHCNMTDVKSSISTIEIGDSKSDYLLLHWLPLNARNYALYQSTYDLVGKIKILEHILIGNVLSFLKGVGVHLDEQLELCITDITNQHVVNYKQVKLTSFDVRFKANISLPSYIGIGKNASIGYGIIKKNNNQIIVL